MIEYLKSPEELIDRLLEFRVTGALIETWDSPERREFGFFPHPYSGHSIVVKLNTLKKWNGAEWPVDLGTTGIMDLLGTPKRREAFANLLTKIDFEQTIKDIVTKPDSAGIGQFIEKNWQ